jgi:hypothetical protein
MKKLILIGLIAIGLISCKKKETTQPETKTTTTPLTTQDKTISISCQTSCGGVLRVIWDWDYSVAQNYSI